MCSWLIIGSALLIVHRGSAYAPKPSRRGRPSQALQWALKAGSIHVPNPIHPSAMTIDVDASTGNVQINIAGNYNAEQMLVLLKELAAARAKVAREPMQPPTGGGWMASRAACHTALVANKGPESLISFRFSGLGWIGSTLTPNMRKQLLRLLFEQQSAYVDTELGNIPPAPKPKVLPLA